MEADRDAVSAGLAFQLQPTAALACNKGLTPICGPTKEANEPPSYVLSLGGQFRQVYEQSPSPATGSLQCRGQTRQGYVVLEWWLVVGAHYILL